MNPTARGDRIPIAPMRTKLETLEGLFPIVVVVVCIDADLSTKYALRSSWGDIHMHTNATFSPLALIIFSIFELSQI